MLRATVASILIRYLNRCNLPSKNGIPFGVPFLFFCVDREDSNGSVVNDCRWQSDADSRLLCNLAPRSHETDSPTGHQKETSEFARMFFCKNRPSSSLLQSCPSYGILQTVQHILHPAYYELRGITLCSNMLLRLFWKS